MTTDWISLPLVVLPLVSSFVLLAFVAQASPSARERLGNSIRMISLVISLAMLALTTAMFMGNTYIDGTIDWANIAFGTFNYDPEPIPLIESLGVHWTVGMDALSFPMVWLTTFLLPITIIATWHEKNGATYFPLILMMGGALIGVFVVLDLFMFYVFWELTLIPMFFLILKWGGKDRKYDSQ